jgi:hypothetical protein
MVVDLALINKFFFGKYLAVKGKISNTLILKAQKQSDHSNGLI